MIFVHLELEKDYFFIQALMLAFCPLFFYINFYTDSNKQKARPKKSEKWQKMKFSESQKFLYRHKGYHFMNNL